jgi:hypothetical protein
MRENAVQASTSAARALKPGIEPAEWKVRVDLAAAFRLAAMQEWDELLFAHLSARVPNHLNQFLMHPAAILFEEVTARRELQSRRAERRTAAQVRLSIPQGHL